MDLNWLPLARTDEVPAGDVRTFAADGTEVALYQVDGEFFATSAYCTHGFARLSDGFLEGFEIECPLHQGRFDVRDGRPLCPPLTEAVKSFPVRVENDTVLIGLPLTG
jgi:naphthalene 1,2-dioxygenase system ferredoxin subunit